MELQSILGQMGIRNVFLFHFEFAKFIILIKMGVTKIDKIIYRRESAENSFYKKYLRNQKSLVSVWYSLAQK